MKWAKFAPIFSLICGCGGSAAEAPLEAAKPTLLEEMSSIAQRDRALAKTIDTRRAFVARANGFETSPSAPADAAFVRLNSSGDFELSSSRRNRRLATLHTTEALTLAAGNLVATDSLWLQSGDKLEQLRLSRSGAGMELGWQLVLEPPIVGARLERSGALLLTDAHDRGILRVPRPYAVDGAGTRLEGRLDYRVEYGRNLSIDLRFSIPGTTSPPLLIDPALAVVLWQEREGEQPVGRVRTAVAYHPELHAVVLHGGNDDAPFDSEILNDTWAYADEWTQLEPLGGPRRYSHSLAYSAEPPSLLLFGGRDENHLLSGTTFRFRAGEWTEVATSGPSKRDDLSMTHAPGLTGGDVVLFGGYGSSLEDDTWLWNGNEWAVQANAGGPAAYGQSMVFDTARGRALVFGGTRSVSSYSSSLSLFNGTRWIDTPDPSAPKRAYAAMAFDSSRRRAVLFGGEDSEAHFLDETWEWDSESARWSERQTDVAPPPLAYGSMAYDPERKRAVLVGGWAEGFLVLGQTWEYRALGGSCESDANCEGVSCVDGACCKQSECGTCEACSSASGECEPVTSAADPDSCADDQTCDERGVCGGAGAARCRSDAECASGACADGVCCDRACDGACEACDLDGKLGTCSYVKGAARHGICDADAGCGGECDGVSASCPVVDAGVACGSSCRDGKLSLSACDGSGACVAEPSAACPRSLACRDEARCLSRCVDDEDCREGLTCRDGACETPGVYCSERSVLHELDGSERSCAPYACVSGACLEACTSAAQCAEGLVCDEHDTCISPSSVANRTSDGCGCRAVGAKNSSAGSFSLMLLLALLRSGRSRRAAARA